MSQDRAEQKAFYRFLHNDNVSEQKLTSELSSRCARAAKGKLVLAIQDTTEVNLASHFNRLDKQTGVGIIDSPIQNHIGFKLHPSIVIDAASGFPLGIADVHVWNRPLEKRPPKNKRTRSSSPVDQKESIRWIRASEHIKECLQDAAGVLIIQDREGDMFEQFEQIPDQKTHLLVRSRFNRSLRDGRKLWHALSLAPLAGSYQMAIDADKKLQEPARTATAFPPD